MLRNDQQNSLDDLRIPPGRPHLRGRHERRRDQAADGEDGRGGQVVLAGGAGAGDRVLGERVLVRGDGQGPDDGDDPRPAEGRRRGRQGQGPRHRQRGPEPRLGLLPAVPGHGRRRRRHRPALRQELQEVDRAGQGRGQRRRYQRQVGGECLEVACR